MSLPTRIGRYDIVELVGRGGMGAVYRGRDAVLERDVAIKMMSADYVEDEERRGRFYREARAAAKLQHRNIITIYEFGEHDGHPYMAMEFLRGMDLQRRLRVAPKLTLEQKLDYAIGLLSGLGLAHQNGVIHRDVKPANLWILEDGTVKLLDFGIAKLGASSSTRHGGVMGTVAYMSPEQVSGKVLDGRSDIFSAGVVLYEMLSGRKPFEGETVTEVMVGIIERTPTPIPELAPALRTVLDKALEKNPDARYQTAFDFAADLQLIRGGTKPDGTPLGAFDLPLRATAASVAGPDALPTAQTSIELPLGAEGHLTGAPATAPPQVAGRKPTLVWVGLAAAIVVAAVVVGVFLRGGTPQVVSPQEPGASPAAAQVAPAATGTAVSITTTPSGASVSLNGTAVEGRTPVRITVPASGAAALSMSLDGYAPMTADLTPAQVASGTFDWSFVPLAAETTLQVSAPYAFDLQKDGRAVARAAASHSVKARAGEMFYAVAPEVFLRQRITIPASAPAVVRIGLPELGRLSVRTSLETCEVVVDGRSAGFPPLADQEIVSGSHILELKCPDGSGPRQALSVPAGGSIVVLCQPAGCQVR